MRKLCKSGIVYISIVALLMGCGQSNDVPAVKESIMVNSTTVTSTAAEAESSKTETTSATETTKSTEAVETAGASNAQVNGEAVQIVLSDNSITVAGQAASTDESSAVYTAKDIVYYEAGKDFTYGEGTAADEHTTEEAAAHTVVHITQPGTYEISGMLSAGQIAVDLGEDAEENPEAVVTLILNNVDISCSVAPAVIFYNVYECGSKDEATKDVDTSKAGANVVIADGSVNNVTGSYVARIYKSYELNEAGTAVVDSKKLHKYDAAFYSKMSMNVTGGEAGTGVLNIKADNEGLDSELHLTINGGNINITSGNDGINTNEDGVSVTTVNGGTLTIKVDGATGEGDGIDSNGWLVINGGTVIAAACATSGDAGIDSDMGIHINGGTVVATGNMLDRISESAQNYAVFTFASRQTGGTTYTVKNESGKAIGEWTPENNFTYLIISNPELTEGTYTVWQGDKQLAGMSGEGSMGGPGMGGMMGRPGGGMPQGMTNQEGMQLPEGGRVPEGMTPPEGMQLPEGGQIPEGMTPPEGAQVPEGVQMPEGMTPPEGVQIPEGGQLPEGMTIPEGTQLPQGNRMLQGQTGSIEASTEFVIKAGGNYFSNVTVAK